MLQNFASMIMNELGLINVKVFWKENVRHSLLNRMYIYINPLKFAMSDILIEKSAGFQNEQCDVINHWYFIEYLGNIADSQGIFYH